MTFQKKPTVTLAQVQEASIDTHAKLAAFRNKRQAALLLDDSHKVDVFDAEIAALEKAATRQAEQIQLLERQAAQREVEAIARKRAGLIDQFAGILEEADVKADELQATMEKADQLFRDIVKLRQQARTMWPLGDAHANASVATAEGVALSSGAVTQLLQYEICRVGSRPALHGRPGAIKEPDFPGGLNPRPLDWAGTPERITPLGAALRTASKFGVDMMKGPLDPIKALAPGQSVAPAPGDPRSDAERKLVALLNLQNELSADLSREAEYLEVVNQIAALSSEQPGAPAK